jgi:glycosyltransferase involved in cell wall biosynthesis
MRKQAPLASLIRTISWSFLETLAFKVCNGIIFVSEDERIWASKRFAIHKTTYVLPLILRTDVSQPSTPETDTMIDPISKIIGRKMVLTFVGDMTSIQNRAALDYIVKDFSRHLIASHPETLIVLAGRLPTRHNEPLPTNVVSLGYVSRIERLLSQSDILIAPLPYSSGMSTKLLMYLRTGKPVVATPVSLSGLNVSEDSNLFVAPIDKFAETTINVIERLKERRSERHHNGGRALESDASSIENWDATLNIIIQEFSSETGKTP